MLIRCLTMGGGGGNKKKKKVAYDMLYTSATNAGRVDDVTDRAFQVQNDSAHGHCYRDFQTSVKKKKK